MKLSSIHHIAIIVSDIEKAREFYVQKLGFEVIRENNRAERDVVDVHVGCAGRLPREIFAEKNSPQRVNRPEACGLRHLAFRVESVEETVKELKSLGIECEPVRFDTYTKDKMTFFHDPDGLPIEIHE